MFMWLILFVLFAPFSPSLDLYVSGLFYTPELGFHSNSFFHFLFLYGELFGLAMGGVAAGVCALSFVFQKWKKYRRGSLAIVLTLVVGAGLLTNVCFKGYWGRPRPKQIVEFGGHALYRPCWKPDFHTEQKQKSFPSGHVAIGCFFLSFCLVGKKYRSKLLFASGLFLTLFLGGGLMVARVAQGGHFLSDVLFSPILMWYVAKGAVKFTWVGSELPALCSKQSCISQAPDSA